MKDDGGSHKTIDEGSLSGWKPQGNHRRRASVCLVEVVIKETLMNKTNRIGWQTLLALAISITVAGCATVPALIPVVVVATPLPSPTPLAATPTQAPQQPTEAPADSTATPAASGQRLRLINGGDIDILKLAVLFPGVRVAFGDLAAGQTSEYFDIPGGVYGYAAYEYELNGETVTQPVIDWVGEAPMEGTAFTYTIRQTVTEGGRNWIELVQVTKDE
jgi:hypothetical protein